MNKNETYYANIITRYFAGEATPEEVRELSAWVSSNPENRQVFRESGNAWFRASESHYLFDPDMDVEWEAMHGKIEGVKEDIKAYPYSRTFRQISPSWYIRFAAVFLIAIAVGLLINLFISGPETLTVQTGEVFTELTLPDGSVVSLNQNTTFQYPEKFRKGQRIVALDGEAYFKVAHDPGKPFVLEHNNIRIKVLGTSFSVKTGAQEDNLEVVLINGQVAVYYENEGIDPQTLYPGEKAEVEKSGHHIEVSRNNNPNFLSWKTGLFIFEDETLENIVSVLNNAYNKKIILRDDHLRHCRMTATFDRQPLDAVLEIIAATLDLRIQSDGTTFVLSGAGCNHEM